MMSHAQTWSLPVGMLCLVLCSVLITVLASHTSAASEPTEVVQAPPIPLPPVWDLVRAGHWIHGINWPWDNYGTDLGSNDWGYRGIANQGPSGWRRETRGNDQAAKRLFWARRDTDDYCLGVAVKLQGALSNALVFFRVDEAAEKSIDETLDLTGQTVTADVYLPSSMAGPEHARSGVMLFFQDRDWTWAQTEWKNIGSNMAPTNQWMTLTVKPDDLVALYPGFDPATVRTVGIKVGTNSGVDESFVHEGPFYIDNVKGSNAPEMQFDFKSPDNRIEEEIKDIAGLKIKAVRWWLLADGRASLQFDNQRCPSHGSVTGLADGFDKDFDEMIRLARSAKIYLVLTLFDFLIGGEAQCVDNVQTFGRAYLITDESKRQSLLKALSDIFDKLASINEVVIIDLFNEPEWLLSDIDIPPEKRPPEIHEGGVVDLATMKTFFSAIIELYKQKGLEGKHLLTIGSASPQWVTLWEDLDLDIAQFHLWNGPGQIDEGLLFDFPPPISEIPTFLGEFTTSPELALQTPCEYLQNALTLGYSGAFPWAYRAKDEASLSLLGEETRNCLLTFAAPSLSLSLNKTHYSIGDVLTLTATVTPGSMPRVVDAYVAIALPDQTWFFMQADGSFTPEIRPLVSNWTAEPFSGEIFGYSFNGREPTGTYIWLATVTEPGMLTIIGEIALAPFTFSP